MIGKSKLHLQNLASRQKNVLVYMQVYLRILDHSRLLPYSGISEAVAVGR